MSQVVVKPPLRERINLRMIVFFAVVLLIIGYPAWVYIDSELTGGIHDAGDGYIHVDLKRMSSFSFDRSIGRIEDVPQQWRDLDGKKVILEGEIAPTTFATRSLNEFELVYSVQQCCFTGAPQVQHFVQSRLINGEKSPYYTGFVKVKGVLHVDVKRHEGQVNSVYQLDVETIEPAT